MTGVALTIRSGEDLLEHARLDTYHDRANTSILRRKANPTD